jgi:epoxide hydrolase-like predicted phosphatase
MTIKTILFDFGGVLYKLPTESEVEQLKMYLGLEKTPAILKMLTHPHGSGLMRKVFLGQVSEAAMWSHLAEEQNLTQDIVDKFKALAFSPRQLNRKMADFLAELHQSYQTAILSNAGDQTRHLIVDVFHLDQWVEEIIISAEEGLIKPDPAIYQVAMDRLGAQPASTLFLDDDQTNVQSASAVGMQTVQYQSDGQAMQDIRRLLKEEG